MAKYKMQYSSKDHQKNAHIMEISNNKQLLFIAAKQDKKYTSMNNCTQVQQTSKIINRVKKQKHKLQ